MEAMEIGPGKCGKCRHRSKSACMLNPPIPMFVPQTNPLTGQQSMALIGVYPPVKEETEACSHFQRWGSDA
jgi:hypothetical protein